MHFIHHHHFVGKEAADTVKIDRDSGVTNPIISNPVDVVIEGVKPLHEPACPGKFNITLTACVVDQLELIDAEGDKVRYVGWGRIAQARVKLDALPLGRVMACGGYNQPGNFVLRDHFGLIESEGWGRNVARADMDLEAVGEAGLCRPTCHHV